MSRAGETAAVSAARVEGAGSGAAAGSAEAEQRRLERLRQDVQRILGEREGIYGFAVRNLDSGAGFDVNGDLVFNTASVIKIPIMVEVYQQARAGTFSLDDPLEMKPHQMVGGSGLLRLFHAGLQMSVRDAVVAMIVISDNTTTNMCLDLVGIESVNRTLRELGLEQTTCRRTIDFKEPDSIVKEPIGVTTPNEMNRLNALIADHAILDASACDDMLWILSRQQATTMVPRYIPRTSDPATGERTPRICHKTGGAGGVRNDSGILYVPNGPRLTFSAFSMEVPDSRWSPDNEAVLTIARVGKLLYDAYADPLHGRTDPLLGGGMAP